MPGKNAAVWLCNAHKSFVVNLDQVRGIKGYEITMMDGSVLPLSQKKGKAFREELNLFLAGRL